MATPTYNADLVHALTPFAGGVAHRVVDPRWHAILLGAVLDTCGWYKTRADYPGTNPVSLSRAALPTLAYGCVTGAYLACEKTDGVRYLWCAVRAVPPGESEAQSVTLMMDRSLSMWLVRHEAIGLSLFDGTAIDGELVTCADGVHRFVAFDMQAHAGSCLVSTPFRDRLRCLAYALDVEYRASASCDPFVLVRKEYFGVDQERTLLWLATEYADDELPYPSDGLLFAPVDAPMRMGRDDAVIKWKRAGTHTVDLALSRSLVCDTGDAYDLMMLTVDGRMAIVCGGVTVSDEELAACGIRGSPDALPQPVIVECAYDEPPPHVPPTVHERTYGRWRPIKLRVDKRAPNYCYTLQKTVENIREDVRLRTIVEALRRARGVTRC